MRSQVFFNFEDVSSKETFCTTMMLVSNRLANIANQPPFFRVVQDSFPEELCAVPMAIVLT